MTVHARAGFTAVASDVDDESGIRVWDPPHEAHPLTDDDRRRILVNIAEAFASQGWGLRIIGHGNAA